MSTDSVVKMREMHAIAVFEVPAVACYGIERFPVGPSGSIMFMVPSDGPVYANNQVRCELQTMATIFDTLARSGIHVCLRTGPVYFPDSYSPTLLIDPIYKQAQTP